MTAYIRCKCCGAEVDPEHAGKHLAACMPSVADAISVEFNDLERAALEHADVVPVSFHKLDEIVELPLAA